MSKPLVLSLIGLGVVIIVASVLFVLVHKPSSPLADISPADVEAVARMIVRGETRVTPVQLADWIIQDRQDRLLLDIRSPERFSAQPIPTARHMPVTRLLNRETLEGLPKDRLIVLYSEDTEQAAQASALLRLAGLQVSFLSGGFEGWNEQVVYPRLGADLSETEFRKRQAMAQHFGGDVQTAVTQDPFGHQDSGLRAQPPQAPRPQPSEKATFTSPLSPAEPASPAGEKEDTAPAGELIVDEGC